MKNIIISTSFLITQTS